MLRSSSKRALSSTRQTDCFPSSAHWISEPTSTLSSLVRYTAVFIAMTSGSRTAACANTSKLAMNEPYGWWTSTSPRRISSKIRGSFVCALGEARGNGRDPGLVLQLRTIDCRELHELGRGRAGSRRGRSASRRRRARSGAARPSPRRRTSSTSTRTTSPKRRRAAASRRPRGGRRRRRRPRSRRRASRGRPRARRCPRRGRASAGSGR